MDPAPFFKYLLWIIDSYRTPYAIVCTDINSYAHDTFRQKEIQEEKLQIESNESQLDYNQGYLYDLCIILPELLSRIGGIPPILEELSTTQLACLAGGSLLKFCSQQKPNEYFQMKMNVKRLLETIPPSFLVQLWIGLGRLPLLLSTDPTGGGHIKVLSSLVDSTSRLFLQFTEAISSWIEEIPQLRIDLLHLLYFYVSSKSDGFLSASAPVISNSIIPSSSNNGSTFVKDNISGLCAWSGLDLPRAALILYTLSHEINFVKALDYSSCASIEDSSIFDTEKNALLSKGQQHSLEGLFWKLSLGDISFPESEYDKLITWIDTTISNLSPPALSMSQSTLNQLKRDKLLYASLKEAILAEKRHKKDALFNFGLIKPTEPEGINLYMATNTTIQIGQVNMSGQALQEKERETYILEHVIIPRVLLSPVDAIYCAIWIRKCHENEWPLFTLLLLDRLFSVSVVLLSGLTLQESINFGRFLRIILEWLSTFSHVNITTSIVSKETLSNLTSMYTSIGSKYGFCPLLSLKRTRKTPENYSLSPSILIPESSSINNNTATNVNITGTELGLGTGLICANTEITGIDPSTDSNNHSLLHAPHEPFLSHNPHSSTAMGGNAIPLSFTQFSIVFRKWHIKLYRSFVRVLGPSSSYLRIRNALVVLTLLVDSVFPILDTHGVGLERLVSPLAEEQQQSDPTCKPAEASSDIRLLARRCLSLLRARSHTWVPSGSSVIPNTSTCLTNAFNTINTASSTNGIGSTGIPTTSSISNVPNTISGNIIVGTATGVISGTTTGIGNTAKDDTLSKRPRNSESKENDTYHHKQEHYAKQRTSRDDPAITRSKEERYHRPSSSSSSTKSSNDSISSSKSYKNTSDYFSGGSKNSTSTVTTVKKTTTNSYNNYNEETPTDHTRPVIRAFSSSSSDRRPPRDHIRPRRY